MLHSLTNKYTDGFRLRVNHIQNKIRNFNKLKKDLALIIKTTRVSLFSMEIATVSNIPS